MVRTEDFVVGIGEILWDSLPGGDRLGGAPTNFAFHIGELGGNARIISRIGNDLDGRTMLALLTSLGINQQYIQMDAAQPTGRVEVELCDGNPTYRIGTPSAWDFLEFTEDVKDLAAKTAAVSFNTLAQRNDRSLRCVQEFVRLCPPGALRLFDINLRQDFYSREVIEFGLRHADILKINDAELDELSRMLGKSRGGTVKALLENYHLELVALTRGEDGCEVHTATERIIIPGIPVKMTDAVGAGDAFSAGLVFALLRGKPPREAAQFANRVGAYVASCPGATPKLPSEIVRL